MADEYPREMAEHFDGTEAQARAYERLRPEPTTSTEARELAELVLASPPYSVLHPAETGGALARALLAALDENERLREALGVIADDRIRFGTYTEVFAYARAALADEAECSCGEINTRHCRVHGDSGTTTQPGAASSR